MLSRRRFVAGISSGLSLAGFASPYSLLAASPRSAATEEQRRWLLAVLPQEDQRYDPFAKMLVTSASRGPGYHSTLKSGDVHATRASLNYAAALLDSGERWRIERANEIIRVVVGLQDKDSSSKTHGLWPWYLEEPLAKMSPPDWNWADFCAMPLLMSWMNHRENLKPPLADQVREAVVHATQSIQRRNVGPGYTNIAVLGTAVTLIAAQELKLPELRAYAKERLRALYTHVMQQGSFAEYNSPTYMIVVLQELSRMLWLVRDGRDKSMVTALHDLAWKHVATHFHPPTRQWAGPHSRSYETDLRKRPATLAFIQAACGKSVELGCAEPLPLGLEAYQVPLQCPRKWARLFGALEAPKQVVETFVQADGSKEGSKNPVVGTTWLHPRFSLGSVNRGDLWQQRRPLLAYWGIPSGPRFLRVRFLKDDADFSSALFFSTQHEGAALAVVTLCTDHGDTHPSLAPLKDASIKASSLRLRFEFGGELAECTVRTVDGKSKVIVIQDRDVRFVLRPVASAFGGSTFRWEFPELKLANHIDAIAYQGEAKEHKLEALGDAFVAFTLEEWPYDQRDMPAAVIETALADGKFRARWITRGKSLDIEAPVKPASYAAMNDALRSAVI